ncbi:DNA photolyase [Alphaproteobacteria bacterium]|nr:DNA photolyase [Alphaproteobacteria bacterium]
MEKFSPSRKQSKKRLIDFVENDLKDYSFRRNYDYGINNRDNISCLSPYISHGVIQEKEILEKSLNKHSYEVIEKFIQEVLWRNYWKGWLELRPSLWQDYLKDLQELENHKLDNSYLEAVSGNTKIECFNDWVNELKKEHYLHNHTRMWFASIWIFTLKLPWQLGAEFFMKYLFDGDPASNTLGWRWVAGLQTIGKHYLASSSNINKYTNNKYRDIPLENHANAITSDKSYSAEKLNLKNTQLNDVNEIIVFDNYLAVEEDNLCNLNLRKVYLVENNNTHRIIKLDEDVVKFKKELLIDQANRLKDKNIDYEIIQIDELKLLSNVEYAYYPTIGENLDFITNNNIENLNFVYRDIDLLAWPYCEKGFFNFKKNIPTVLKNI